MTFRKTCNNCQRLQCFRCHSTGHLENSCPDLWRRFHDTVNNSFYILIFNGKCVY